MSCDGCTIAVAGATNPGIEGLLLGTVPAMPRCCCITRSCRSKPAPTSCSRFTTRGTASSSEPYVVVFEGRLRRAHCQAHGRVLLRHGVEAIDGDEHGQPVPTATWLSRLAPGRGDDCHRHLRDVGGIRPRKAIPPVQ